MIMSVLHQAIKLIFQTKSAHRDLKRWLKGQGGNSQEKCNSINKHQIINNLLMMKFQSMIRIKAIFRKYSLRFLLKMMNRHPKTILLKMNPKMQGTHKKNKVKKRNRVFILKNKNNLMMTSIMDLR